MSALACWFSKPRNLALGVKPAGTASPTREAGGNTGSAAWAGAAKLSVSVTTAGRRVGRSIALLPMGWCSQAQRERNHRRPQNVSQVHFDILENSAVPAGQGIHR